MQFNRKGEKNMTLKYINDLQHYTCLFADDKSALERDGNDGKVVVYYTDKGYREIWSNGQWRGYSENVQITGRKPDYTIPMMDLLAWSGFTNQPANDGVEVVSNSASDVGKCTIFGTTNGTGAFAYETITLTGATAKATTKTDWGNIYGVFLGDIYGKNISPAVGTITVREASDDQTITTLTAGAISKGMVVFDLTGKYITLNVHNGNAWVKTTGVVTTANGFKINFTGGNILELDIDTYLYMISDTTGATAQILVWQ
ncbi:MAG: hypothetical protein LLF98_01935 [Clostridium sp.]|nr:hypothetical protein [Clostridium sp.]